MAKSKAPGVKKKRGRKKGSKNKNRGPNADAAAERQALWEFDSNMSRFAPGEIRRINARSFYNEEFALGTLKKGYKQHAEGLLDEAVENTPKGVEVFFATITPELAKFLFLYRCPNRIIARSMVAQYKSEMECGKWNITGQAIVLDLLDRVLDGVHRLVASIESGKSFTTLVVTGVDSKRFEIMDQGRARNPSNMIQVYRDGNGNRLDMTSEIAAGITLAIRYARQVYTGSTKTREKIHARVPLNVFKANPEWAKMAQWFKSMRKDLASLGISAAPAICGMFFMFMTNPKKAEAYWDGLAYGIGLTKNSPVLAARNFQLQEIVGKEMDKPATWMLSSFATSWNALLAQPTKRITIKRKKLKRFQEFEGSEALARSLLKYT